MAEDKVVPVEVPDHLNVPPQRQFKAISGSDYSALDMATRDRMVRTRHMGIIQNSEKKITALLIDALTQPRAGADGQPVPPYKRQDLLVVLINRDDPIFPVELRDTLEDQDLQVGIFVVERLPFANHILNFVSDPEPGQPPPARPVRPYRKAGRALLDAPPENCVFFAVFDCGMCTVTFIGFDPEQQMENVPVDPHAKLPPAVDPLPNNVPRADG